MKTLLLYVMIGFGFALCETHCSKPHVPDENAAGVALLAEKLTGPGFFQPMSYTESKGGYITREDALSQIPKVMLERRWEASRADQVRALIEEVTEPPPSRMFGQPQIKLVRLNLALDAMH